MSIEHVFVSVRPYRRGDREAIAALLRAHDWPERYVRGQVHAAAAFAASPRGKTLIAAAADSVVGFVSVQFHEWNGLAQLHGLAVDVGHLRRGIGTELLDVSESIAREHACRGIYVDTPVDNAAGRAFYASQGFSEDYRMTRYYSDDSDGVTYVKFFRARG
jgi:ribosomal protein S18 acetylase RimI-like enzyme